MVFEDEFTLSLLLFASFARSIKGFISLESSKIIMTTTITAKIMAIVIKTLLAASKTSFTPLPTPPKKSPTPSTTVSTIPPITSLRLQKNPQKHHLLRELYHRLYPVAYH